jgi:hypothetical protein
LFFPVQLSGGRKAQRDEVPALRRVGKHLRGTAPRHDVADATRSREAVVAVVGVGFPLVTFVGSVSWLRESNRMRSGLSNESFGVR